MDTDFRGHSVRRAHPRRAHPDAVPAPRRPQAHRRARRQRDRARPKPQPDGTLVKALARAWRWQRLLDQRPNSAPLADLADTDRISRALTTCRSPMSYAPGSRRHRTDPRRDGLRPGLAQFLKPSPVEWGRQRGRFTPRGCSLPGQVKPGGVQIRLAGGRVAKTVDIPPICPRPYPTWRPGFKVFDVRSSASYGGSSFHCCHGQPRPTSPHAFLLHQHGVEFGKRGTQFEIGQSRRCNRAIRRSSLGVRKIR